MTDPLIQDLLRDLSGLSPDDQRRVREFVAFLRWRADQARRPIEEEDALHLQAWRYSFLENLSSADIGSSRNSAGMEVKAAEAVVGGEAKPALWQHPPVEGEAIAEYHVPVPAGLQNLRLRFTMGIRDGARARERLVAFRVRVDGWQVWSRAAWPTRWDAIELPLPFHAGDVLRLAFVTDGLGDHEFAWAAWGDPELMGELQQG